MLYWILFAAIAFPVGLQILANREMRVREPREFECENGTRSAPPEP